MTISQRFLANVAAVFSKPQFLYFQVCFFGCWIALGPWIERLTAGAVPAFSLQEQGIDMASLLIATGVLVYQNRQEKISEQRSHLMLQINLLNEQKIAKLIGLVEELRKDSPDVRDREDWEAQVMQESTDPQIVLNIIQENLEHLSEGEAMEAIARNKTIDRATVATSASELGLARSN